MTTNVGPVYVTSMDADMVPIETVVATNVALTMFTHAQDKENDSAKTTNASTAYKTAIVAPIKTVTLFAATETVSLDPLSTVPRQICLTA